MSIAIVTGAIALALGFAIFRASLTSAEGAMLTAGVGVLVLALSWPILAGIVRRARPVLSRINGLHVLWGMVFLSGLVFRIRNIEEIQESPIDPWAIWRAGLIAIVAFALLLSWARRRSDWPSSLGRGLLVPMSAYCLISIVSVSWSAFPEWTAYKAAEYTIDVLLLAAVIAAVRETSDLKQLLDWTWILLALLLVSVWLGAIIWPEEAILWGVGVIGMQVQGVLPIVAANGVGQISAILAVVMISRIARLRAASFAHLAVLVFSVVSLLLSQSRSPLFGLILGSAIVLIANRLVGVWLFLVLISVSIFGLSPIGDTAWEFLVRGQSQELIESLSGRTVWWAAAIEAVREQPWTGFGAYAGSRFVALSSVGAHETSSIHNAWLEVLLGSGILGLCALVAMVGACWIALIRALRACSAADPRRWLIAECLGVLCILSVRSMFTSEFIWHPPIVFFAVIAVAEIARRNWRGQSEISG